VISTVKTMHQVWVDYKEMLDALEVHIAEQIVSDVPLIQKVAQYTLRSGGKRFRPLLLALSAEMCGCFDRRAILTGGGIIEFVHTATLLHDDVLDQAETRRGTPAARAVWGNHACILVGDYLYTLAACQASGMGDFEINDLFAQTCRQMSEGETLQLMHHDDFDLPEETHLRIIDRKTASLFSAGCRLGGIIASASEDERDALSRFGRAVGVAFQLADDTLDYVACSDRWGKTLGKDFREGKITLPLLHLLSQCTPTERESVRSQVGTPITDDGLKEVVAMMRHHGSLAYTAEKAQQFSDAAKSALSIFPDSPHRQSLITISDYVVRRES
jgi:octaprenyl-diphosphate synthase